METTKKVTATVNGVTIAFDRGKQVEDRGEDKASYFVAGSGGVKPVTCVGSDGKEYCISYYVGIWKPKAKTVKGTLVTI